ncbi:AraC family transcriptional regulator [Streptomyces fulvorobeus]|uniref:AraC family transcriptional regulator n=1 Tax=Streptomyces fulvorobeus TaxID=284028 RepID=A0A7J0CF84_9ACTN|nr:AraC family transcriptional regulator [Streptomyces fulvorobeus]NYE44616.1 AraC-like DNA-binding protein [Streptomyces fulvorobeus]GFN01163.1 AraC family transcriptional regulator [Streptomyces fulvorobeus]
MDPLEEILTLVDVRAERASTLTGHGDWALRFPAPAGAKFNSVLSGSCMIDTPGLKEPLQLRTGDSFLLTRPQEFVLSTSARASVQQASPIFRATEGTTSVEIGPLGQPVSTRLVGGSFAFGRRARELLLDTLPPLIHLPAHAEGATMVPHLLNRIDHEARTAGLGAHVVSEHLAVVLLVDVLRCHLMHQPDRAGWLQGLGDPVVSTALRAIHADPARRWTVRLLADAALVSRSTLAARFKAAVGKGPLEYLTRWRLELGAHRLASTDQTIAVIADAVGYSSEASFALAFKRELGTAPGIYRKEIRHQDGTAP